MSDATESQILQRLETIARRQREHEDKAAKSKFKDWLGVATAAGAFLCVLCSVIIYISTDHATLEQVVKKQEQRENHGQQITELSKDMEYVKIELSAARGDLKKLLSRP